MPCEKISFPIQYSINLKPAYLPDMFGSTKKAREDSLLYWSLQMSLSLLFSGRGHLYFIHAHL